MLLWGCSGARSESTLDQLNQCGKTTPVFDSTLPPPAPKDSEIVLEVKVSEAALSERLSEAVPHVLARESGRSMGTPGKVSYEVRRGDFRFEPREGALSVTTSLVADIEVCKPLGPVCLHYGACRPEWAVQVVVPQPLSLEAPPRPTLGLSLTKGCVLRPVGYDATPELRKITTNQARSARAQMQRQIDDQFRLLSRSLRSLESGIRFDDSQDACLRVLPSSIAQGEMTLDEGQLAWTVALQGRAELGCSSDAGEQGSDELEGTPFPTTMPYTEKATPPRVIVASPVTFDQFSEAVLTSLAKTGRKGGLSLVSGTIAGKPHLAAGVSEVADCGEHWVSVAPEVDGNELVLRPTDASRVDAKVVQWLKAHARVALPEALAQLAHKAEQANALGLDAARAELTQRGLKLEMDERPELTAEIESQAIGVQLSMDGRVKLTDTRAAELNRESP